MYSNNIKKIRIVADVASVFAESLERRKLYWAEQLHTGIVLSHAKEKGEFSMLRVAICEDVLSELQKQTQIIQSIMARLSKNVKFFASGVGKNY